MTGKLRWAFAASLLFLIVVIDFTSKMLSVFADGALALCIVAVVWPMLRKSE